jgi:hypothetical protein
MKTGIKRYLIIVTVILAIMKLADFTTIIPAIITGLSPINHDV